MRKKAFLFSTDALIALIVIFLSILVAYPVFQTIRHEKTVHEDVMKVLSTVKIGQIDNEYTKYLIETGKIKDLDKTVLEQIGEFYALEDEEATNLAQAILADFDGEENLGIWYEDELLASVNSTSLEESENIDVVRQAISGIEKGKTLTGYVAKAWLKKIQGKQTTLVVKGDLICGGWKTYSWGEYCGPAKTTITYKINIPESATIDEAKWLVEPTWQGQPTKLFFNGNQLYNSDIHYYLILDVLPYANPGENIAILESNTGGDDGASHIAVKYTTELLTTIEDINKFYFHNVEAKSILHYERSVFIPQEISYISLNLNTSYSASLSIRKGADTVYIGTKSPESGTVTFTDNEIKTALNSAGIQYSNLNNEYLFFIVKIGVNDPGKTVELRDNSYIYIEKDALDIPFGSIDMTKQIEITSKSDLLQDTFYRHLVWTFFLPLKAIPILADWQLGWLSTGGGETSQLAKANEITLFQSPPAEFIEAFSRFGYSPSLAEGLFLEGENNFTLDFGHNYGVSNESSFGYLTYFLRSYVNYGDPKQKARGGIITVQFEDGSTKQFTIGEATDSWDPEIDAIDDAIERLLAQLDSDGDGKLDILLNQDNFDIDSLNIAGIPYIWSTEVQIRRWD